MLRTGLYLFLVASAFAKVYNIRDFGATGDGRADDTTAVQSAMDAAHAAGGGTLYFPVSRACYMVSHVRWRPGVLIQGESQSVCVKKLPTTRGRAVADDAIFYGDVSDSRITALTLDGNRTNQADANGNANEGSEGIDLRGPTNVMIDNLLIKDCALDGIYITGAGAEREVPGNGILISRVTITNSRRNGLTIITGRNITVRDSIFERSQGTDPQAGVDIEPNTAQQRIENVVFENCIFRDSRKHGFQAWIAFASQPGLNLQFYECLWERNGANAVSIAAADGTGFLLDGVYVSGTARDNGLDRSQAPGGVDICNASHITLTNLSVSGARQGVIVGGRNGPAELMIANSRLSGSDYDAKISTADATVYDSTVFAHDKVSGSFARRAGSAPKITTASLSPIEPGWVYSAALAATGDGPVIWAVVGGTLPPGISVSRTGELSGRARSPGEYLVTLRASNSVTWDQKTYVLTVAAHKRALGRQMSAAKSARPKRVSRTAEKHNAS